MSQTFREWRQKLGEAPLEAVVIGSGYGGSVAALRLARELELDVTVLERGSEYVPGDFPNDLSLVPSHMRLPTRDGNNVAGRPNGLLDWRIGENVASLVANGVGGGSLINAGVCLRPDRDVLEQPAWPDAIRHADMEPWFQRAETGLHAEQWPADEIKSQSFAALVQHKVPAAHSGSLHAEPVKLTVDRAHCTRCGDCTTGCNVPNAKRALTTTYLPEAVAAGATIVEGTSVWAIAPHASDARAEVALWRLTLVETAAAARWPRMQDAVEAEGFEVLARRVVLCAGTLGSTELLQRSRALSGRSWWLPGSLGERFSANGDSLSFITDVAETVNAIGIGADDYLTRVDVTRGQVGPTITRKLQLTCEEHPSFFLKRRRVRAHSGVGPLTKRLCIQDGAIPGALARAFGEALSFGATLSRLEHWQSTPHAPKLGVDTLAAGDDRRAGPGNSTALPQRTHVVLSMGHDESRGRIEWRPERNHSVAAWDEPQKLDTYATREALFKETAAAAGGEWVPDLAWRPVPKAVTDVMSGPQIEPTLTTVHPLGGCAMGDDPRTSVVDHLGRLWRSDHLDDAPAGQTWATHDNFLVLDGSTIPTALGVNPILTITALAERALDAYVKRHDARAVLRAPRVFPPPAVRPPPLTRAQAPDVWDARMQERLVCKQLEIRGALRRAFGADTIEAELALKLASSDWLRTWDDPKHTLDELDGSLRLQLAAAVASYVPTGGSCTLLEQPSSSQLHPSLRIAADADAWLRAATTYVILRPDAFESDPDKAEKLSKFLSRVYVGVQQIGHLTERRCMHYEIDFRREPPQASARSLERGYIPVWEQPLAAASEQALPKQLRLFGDKRVEYAATWRELGSWLGARVRQALGGPRAPSLRESFLEQASHLTVKLTDARSGTLAEGRFRADFTAWLRKPAVELLTGDLTGGALVLGAYPALILRYLVKTRLPDFRLPLYRRAPRRTLPDDRRLKWDNQIQGPLGELIPLRVPRGSSSSDEAEISEQELIDLTLCRYKQPALHIEQDRWLDQPVHKLKSVLLVHAFGQSGYTFTLDTLPANLAGAFYAAGYDVWVLDYRFSTRVPAHKHAATCDQVAKHDLPAAVDNVLAQLQSEHPGLQNPQIHVFAQCLGGASAMMSLLSGQLHHPASFGDGAERRHCPKLASLMVSQTHPLCIGQLGSQARSWVPAFLRDGLKWSTVPFSHDGTRGAPDSLSESWLDRLFTALPVPDSERCPISGADDEEDHVTCRRVRFFEAPLFKHANLSLETHRQLPEHFGHVNLQTFAHMSKCVETERLVDEDGRSIYVNEINLRKYANLPVAFLHGADNELFHPQSARSSAELFARVQPAWATRAFTALKARAQVSQRAFWTVPGYGHLDVLIGKNAHFDVYPGIVAFAEHIQTTATPLTAAGTGTSASARAPRSGPFFLPPRRRGDRLLVRVRFMIDDRFSDGKRGHRAVGTRTWAFARVMQPSGAVQTFRLRIAERRTAPRNLWGGELFEPHNFEPAYRFAVGDLRLHAETAGPLQIEAFSVHESLTEDESYPDLRRITPVLQRAQPGLSEDPELDRWLAELMRAREAARVKFAEQRLPLSEDVARSSMYVEPPAQRAVVPASALAAISGSDTLQLLAACCRYPGFPFDRGRADDSVRSVLGADDTLHATLPGEPAFALLLGDQIYADATAGLTDPLSPTERYVERHRRTFERARDDEPPRLGDLLAKLPAVMLPDDHEYVDGYGSSRALLSARPRNFRRAQVAVRRVALDAWRHFQGGMPSGYRHVTAGPVRVLALDTRSGRSDNPCILSLRQLEEISRWLQAEEACDHLNILATGCVILPGLSQRADPSEPGTPDTFQRSIVERDWLMRELAAVCLAHQDSVRFVLLSGDYHLSHVSALQLDGVQLGAAIVAPPLYAPMLHANAHVSDLILDEKLPAHDRTWTLVQQPEHSWSGSGFSRINVERLHNQRARYRVRFQAQLTEHTERCSRHVDQTLEL